LNPAILHKEVQDFIHEHLQSDISKVLFKGSPFQQVNIRELVEQIEAKKRSKKKLPLWFSTQNIYYPNKLNIEQTSSEITATYKSSLISGSSFIDLTGGFGIDSYYFSKRFDQVTHCEINANLSEIVAHNYTQLEAQHIKTIAQNGLTYLSSQQHFDWIYIDPSRRDAIKGKVFLLKDCLPNVPENLELLFEHTENLLLKVSPMLDIASAINALNFVKEVHVVAVNNEVKELLFLLEKEYNSPIKIKTINIGSKRHQYFNTFYKQETNIEFSAPKRYLYEPNAAVLKAGLFNQLVTLGVSKLHQNSHLYTTDAIVDFPGRSFTIKHTIPYDKKLLKKLIPSQKANITVRNFPHTVAEIRKKTKLKEGGHQYLFFTKDILNKYVVLICEKNNQSQI